MIYVYGDDSSDGKKERVSAIGVVFAGKETWEELESKWTARNKGIPFHAKDCESDQGDYKNLPHTENKKLYFDLTTTLVDTPDMGGIGVSIDLVAQRKVFPNSLDLAYYKAFTEILRRLKNLAATFGEVAKLTFDIGPENEYNAALIYANFREENPDMFAHFAPEISFVPARECPRLQVGDLMAYESMKALDHTVGPVKRKRASWEALRATGRFETWGYSEEWFLDLKNHLPALEELVKFNQKDYENWLTEKNRQHNISNLFHFTNVLARHAKG